MSFKNSILPVLTMTYLLKFTFNGTLTVPPVNAITQKCRQTDTSIYWSQISFPIIQAFVISKLFTDETFHMYCSLQESLYKLKGFHKAHKWLTGPI